MKEFKKMSSSPVRRPPDTSENRILRVTPSAEHLGISRQLLYRKLSPADPLFDPDFPKPIKLSARATGFLECELNEWLQIKRQKTERKLPTKRTVKERAK
ncbi:MAG: AlpA family phage regulatory protein [Hydrogenophaga sp.]|uniref:helix-turn-helix transcriptional regulator n=1 Tax=Hydrogenophaga sp. TaxID=1904254 RepID=UPI00261B9F54|nr:AlpA family phage regulatory protein [Hydrogenophaga sp.]MCV0437423.1 AlpA family phage regulatory protein [Hydrogenophaga sp.]